MCNSEPDEEEVEQEDLDNNSLDIPSESATSTIASVPLPPTSPQDKLEQNEDEAEDSD
jgi:hypothetical protein